MRTTLFFIIVITMLLTACLHTPDPYYDQAADISERAVLGRSILIEDALPDLEDCQRSISSPAACDRAVSKLAELPKIVDRARTEMMALDPPPEARRWHSDIIAYYADASESITTIVNAYYAGDLDGFLTGFEELESIMAREDQLILESRSRQD
jgi:hypothetical protein